MAPAPSRSRSIAIAAAWGFAEATLFFVVPDVHVGWVALRRPRRVLAVWPAAVVGGVIGAAALHRMVRAGWEPGPTFASLPGMRADDRQRVRDGVERDVTRAFITAAVTGLPLKLYVAESARQGLPMRRTLLLATINRVPRIGVFALALAAIGGVGRRVGLSGAVPQAVLYGAGWLVFYGWYWIVRSARG